MWVKGNTHTHTNMSDGDASPEEVIAWYKSRGYNFLVLSDHNRVTEMLGHDGDGFILIPGEELSTGFAGSPVHVNALGLKETVVPAVGESMHATIQANIDLVVQHGGLAQVNHPNFGYAFDHRDIRGLTGFKLLEVFNGHPDVHNSGNTAHIPVEQIWDVLLSEGMEIYGVAVDDAHNYIEFSQRHANPGRGWIVVKVDELTAEKVLVSISKGDFYASTGVELKDCSFDGRELRVSVEPREDLTYVIRFIGRYGQILSEVDGTQGSYALTGSPSEAYVRAKVIESNGAVAWTQPVRRR